VQLLNFIGIKMSSTESITNEWSANLELSTHHWVS